MVKWLCFRPRSHETHFFLLHLRNKLAVVHLALSEPVLFSFQLGCAGAALAGAQHAPLCISSPVTSDRLNPDGQMKSVALPSCALLLKVYVHLHFTCITCMCRGYSLLLLLCKKSASKLSSEPRHLPPKMHSTSFHHHC